MKMTLIRKMILGIVAILIIEAAAITFYFSMDTSGKIREQMDTGMREVLASNSRMIDTMLDDIVDRAVHICTDENMISMIMALHNNDIYGMINWEEKGRKLILDHFGMTPYGYEAYIRDINIFSSEFSLSLYKYFDYNAGNFMGCGAYGAGIRERPYYRWIPTMDTEGFLSPKMHHYVWGTGDKADTNVFRLVKQMNISTVVKNDIRTLPKSVPQPYIVISMTPEVLSGTFAMRGLSPNSRYLIVTRDGTIVSSSRAEQNGMQLNAPALQKTLETMGSEYHSGNYRIDGETALTGIWPADAQDWFYVCVVPEKDIHQSAMETFLLYIRLLLLICGMTLALSTVFIRKTMRPFQLLAEKAMQFEKPAANALAYSELPETDRIMTVIESMNEQIEQLAENNSELEQREKDANILMLEMQINPHFLYNSLNKLHVSLINAGQKELASRVIALSNALRYSVSTKEHLVYLYKEIEQMDLYITAMQNDEENKFSVYYDIDEALYRSIVPKMLLQPFVENSILHGFKETGFGCLIHIEGELQGEDAVYTISDNGVGIPEEKKELLLSGGTGHIGCANVHKRIRLLFGEKYGVQVLDAEKGTRISIRIPYIIEK